MKPNETVFTPASGDPFQVILTGSGIEITGRIDSTQRADELVRAVNALKPLLRARASYEPGMDDCQTIAKALVEHLKRSGVERVVRRISMSGTVPQRKPPE
jgi:hypothetical protein